MRLSINGLNGDIITNMVITADIQDFAVKYEDDKLFVTLILNNPFEEPAGYILTAWEYHKEGDINIAPETRQIQDEDNATDTLEICMDMTAIKRINYGFNRLVSLYS